MFEHPWNPESSLKDLFVRPEVVDGAKFVDRLQEIQQHTDAHAAKVVEAQKSGAPVTKSLEGFTPRTA